MLESTIFDPEGVLEVGMVILLPDADGKESEFEVMAVISRSEDYAKCCLDRVYR